MTDYDEASLLYDNTIMKSSYDLVLEKVKNTKKLRGTCLSFECVVFLSSMLEIDFQKDFKCIKEESLGAKWE